MTYHKAIWCILFHRRSWKYVTMLQGRIRFWQCQRCGRWIVSPKNSP